jgi:hypothetical protein
MSSLPVQCEPIHKPLEEPVSTKTKKKSAHVEASTSFRLGRKVIEAVEKMARKETRESGIEVTKSEVVRRAVMERYRRIKDERKT